MLDAIHCIIIHIIIHEVEHNLYIVYISIIICTYTRIEVREH